MWSYWGRRAAPTSQKGDHKQPHDQVREQYGWFVTVKVDSLNSKKWSQKTKKKGCQRSRKKIMNGGCVNNASSSFNQQNIHHNSLNHRMPRKNIREMVGGCCVCADESGWAENPLVYCDGQGCNVAVHQGLLFFFIIIWLENVLP